MGIAERKQREKQEMKEMILREATAMFIEDGFDKTSIRNIAERIEYSPATIYLYFADKDELFFAIHERGFDILLGEFEKTKNIADPYERLLVMGDVYINFGLNNPEFYDLMFIMRAPVSIIEKFGEWSKGFATFEYLFATVAECIAHDKLNVTDKNPFIVSNLIWSFVHGLVSLWVRGRFTGMLKKADSVKIQQILQTMPSIPGTLPTDEKDVQQMLFQCYETMLKSLRNNTH
jgi:AcrR family transcriptional regulator